MRLILVALVVALLMGALSGGNKSYCEGHPDGIGCIGTQPIRDDADRLRADQRDATQDANDEAIKALCAAARDAGEADACR